MTRLASAAEHSSVAPAAAARLRLLGALLRQFSAREWRHHPWRQLAALIAVMLGVALAFSVQLINQSALAEFSSAARAVGGVPDVELRGPPGGFDESLYARVARHPQVEIASPVIEIDAVALDAAGARVPLKIVGLDPLVAAPLAPALVPKPASGAGLLDVLQPDAVFLNPRARQRLGATPLRVQTANGSVTLRVAGTNAAPGGALATADIAGVQQAFGWVGRLGRIDLRLRAGADRATVLRDLALPPGVRAAAPDEAAERASNVSRAYRVNLTVLALVALFTGAFLVFSILSLSVAQRQPQFALLGVLGLAARDRLVLVLAESALLGALGSALGLALGTGLAALALRVLAGDLGGGFFPGVAPTLQFDAGAALLYGLLGIAAALVGGWLPARQAERLAPAQALKGLGSADSGGAALGWIGPATIGVGVLLAFAPPLGGIPLAAYLSVACLLLGGIACVPAGVALLLRGVAPPRHPLALLAVERARHQRQTAAVAVAGVVASLALSVALTVMVASFRDSVIHWLDTVLPADLYLRIAPAVGGSDTALLPPALPARAAAAAGVARVEALRIIPLSFDAAKGNVALIARPLRDPEHDLPLVDPPVAPPVDRRAEPPLDPQVDPSVDRPVDPAPGRPRDGSAAPAGGAVPPSVYVSEAMVDLYGARPGTTLILPLAGRPAVRVRGVWRDYARQNGSIVIAAADYQRLTGDTRANDLAVWLQPGADAPGVARELRALAAALDVAGDLLDVASVAEIRTASLRIFDRSFAVTYWLQAVAIAIGLFGIAASFSAQVLARRREFGLLAHLGLTRRQILTVVAGEGAVWTGAGAVVGLLLGLAVSVVLVDVVNPQSFHWTMELRLPAGRLAALCLAVIAAGTATAWIAGRRAASRQLAQAVHADG